MLVYLYIVVEREVTLKTNIMTKKLIAGVIAGLATSIVIGIAIHFNSFLPVGGFAMAGMLSVVALPNE